jgi:cytochrome c oxidase cbb3-type subunit III
MNSWYSQFRLCLAGVAVTALLALNGCSNARGRPEKNSEVVPPSDILDFATLFSQNCAGCHGPEGHGAAAITLHNPTYLAIADDGVIRRVVTNGVPGTPMTPFAKSAGGALSDKQVEAIVAGIRSWARPDQLTGVNLPPYKSQSPGNPQNGAEVYANFCASCHGAKGEGTKKASSIVDGSYLALVSDQHLRSIVIAGWPSINSPDWRNDVPGKPLSPQQISDVVAWLVAQRPQFPGQPYPNGSAANRENLQ